VRGRNDIPPELSQISVLEANYKRATFGGGEITSPRTMSDFSAGSELEKDNIWRGRNDTSPELSQISVLEAN